MEVKQRTKPQLFSMTSSLLHPDTVNDDWEMHTEGLIPGHALHEKGLQR